MTGAVVLAWWMILLLTLGVLLDTDTTSCSTDGECAALHGETLEDLCWSQCAASHRGLDGAQP